MKRVVQNTSHVVEFRLEVAHPALYALLDPHLAQQDAVKPTPEGRCRDEATDLAQDGQVADWVESA